jgi:hypothetical protein
MQYAQPWLAAERSEAGANIAYSNALAMHYAQPWLAAEKSEVGATVAYSNALAMQYAQPWLTSQSTLSCHNSLDAFYACQNRD